MVKKDKTKNALLMIPKRNKNITWEKENDVINLKIHRNRGRDKIMHKIFKTPLVINIELDELGAFVWEACDGIKNIQDISEEIVKYFGKRAEPVLERLITYMRILKDNKFIDLE
ncbi:PqqD family protein [Haloimpatiens sp. FM7330]|uniref:PqqD family protein n=1 Tax=Haloimpatiens sp. FM7330 TaxID=3298610 RepID=UPI0036310728